MIFCIPFFSITFIWQHYTEVFFGKGAIEEQQSPNNFILTFNKILFILDHRKTCIHRPIQWKDMILPVNGVGSGVPTDVIFIYSICFKHFLIDLGC